MTKNNYLTAPLPTPKMPGGIPHILTQETFERFSYYGMRSILVLVMTKYLLGSEGMLDVIPKDKAKEYYHLFVAMTYFMPMLGAAISDTFLGKFKTIIIFSIINCLGLLALVVDQSRIGLTTGLILITIGSGFIKPCVSANVGDQFGNSNKHLLAKAYGWFYFVINFGSLFSYLLIPILLEKYGVRVAFSVPAASMLLATFVFWMGRKRFVHAPPAGIAFIKKSLSGEGITIVARLTVICELLKKALSGEEIKIVARLAVIYAFIGMFWSLFSQMDSSWFLQAENMNLQWLGIKWLPAQIGFANPLIVMGLIPMFAFGIYPAMNKVFRVTPLRKISMGLFVAALAFVIPAWNETRISAGQTPSIAWLILAVLVLTIAEVMVSITVLEFSYTQAPKKMKSVIMAISSLAVFAGNMFTSLVNRFIYNEDGASKLEGASYFWFFAGAMLLTAAVFIPFAACYKEHTYIQEETSEGSD